MIPIFDAILKYIPAPSGDPEAPLQMQVASIDHSSFLGRLGIGKVTAGRIAVNMSTLLATTDGKAVPVRITKLYHFERTRKVEVEEAGVGEIVAVAGADHVLVGDTYTDPVNPCPLPALPVDPPTVSMNFLPNNSPFAGQEGEFSQSQHLADRLHREALSDVALHVEDMSDNTGFVVSGRGELHISILVEKMRREGFEFQVSAPHVILKVENGKTLEPYEDVTIDVPEAFMGAVIEKLGGRKGQMQGMTKEPGGMVRLLYKIPTRGLFGFKSEFMSDTKGMGVLNYVFFGYDRHVGDMRNRAKGVLIAMQDCTTVAYALFNLQDRGKLFLGPGKRIYRGQIVGEHCRDNDLIVNPAKGKQLTNIRAAGSDENIILTPPTQMSLETAIAYINDDELVEVTPLSIRLRKKSIDRVRGGD